MWSLVHETYCLTEMQIALKEMSDYDTAIWHEPLTLLTRIESLMYTPERTKYPSLTIVEVLNNFLKTKQREYEDLFDYLR